jgi:hypothetical protein
MSMTEDDAAASANLLSLSLMRRAPASDRIILVIFGRDYRLV